MPGRRSIVLVAAATTVLATAAVAAPAAEAAKVKPPAKVSKARVAKAATNAVAITWKNPKSKTFTGTVVRFAPGTKAPKTIKAGRAGGTVGKKQHGITLGRLTAGTTYTVSLFAHGHGKAYSKPVALRIRTAAKPKSAPKPAPVVALAPVSNVRVFIQDGAANISWTPPVNNPKYNGVKIFRTLLAGTITAHVRVKAAAAGGSQLVAELDKSQTSYVDRTIEAGKNYSYSVVSKDASNNTAAPANPPAPVVTRAATQPVTDLTVDYYAAGNEVELGWNNPADENFDGARIVRVDGATPPTAADHVIGTTGDGTSFFADENVSAGKTYSYGVFAVNPDGIATSGPTRTITINTDGVTGLVRNASGSPLEGVSVVAYDTDGNRAGDYASTDEQGAYTVTGLAAGDYRVCFDTHGVTDAHSATGYQPQCADGVSWNSEQDAPEAAKEYVVAAGKQTRVVTAVLAAGHELYGTVKSGAAKLGSVRVVAFGTDGARHDEADTDDDGTYSLTGLPAGDYTVCAFGDEATGGSAGGYLDQCYVDEAWTGDDEDLPGDAAHVDVTAHQPTDLSLHAAGGISGTVRGGTTALQDAYVTLFEGDLNQDTVTTDKTGSFTFKGLAAGDYTVCVSAEDVQGAPIGGYQAACYDGVAWNPEDGAPASATTITVTAGMVAEGKNFSLAAGGAVGGTVSDPAAPGEHPSTLVVLFDAHRQSRSTTFSDEADGSYEFDGLPAGTYYVCVQPDDGETYLASCVTNAVWPGGDAPADATPITVSTGVVAPADVTLLHAGTISGAVTSDGEPVGAYVHVYTTSGEQVTSQVTDVDGNDEETGTYDIGDLAPGTYHVCFDPYDRTSYASQCWKNVAWNGGAVPSGVKDVVVAGNSISGIDAALEPAA